jgi:hypothetical protein
MEATPQVQPVSRYVSEIDLEAMTAISRRTWQKHRLMGTGPRFYKINGGTGKGGAVRYNLDEVMNWIHAGVVEPGPR